MMVAGSPPRATVRPRTERSPPNRVCQRASLIRATGCEPHFSSSAEKPRPNAGSTPKRGNRLAVTWSARTRSGSCAPVRFSGCA